MIYTLEWSATAVGDERLPWEMYVSGERMSARTSGASCELLRQRGEHQARIGDMATRSISDFPFMVTFTAAYRRRTAP
jgi:hypothetical protein